METHDWVGNVDTMRETTANDQGQNVHWNQIDQKDITTPWGDHVKVGKSAWCGPINAAGFDCLDPKPVGEQHAKDSNAFVIVWTSDRTWNIAWHNRDQTGGHETSAGVLELGGEQVSDNCGQWREKWRQEYANVSYINGDMQEVENVIEERWGDHETGIDGTTDDSSQWIPSSIVEPIVKAVEAFFGQIFCGSIVKIRIEFVNHGLVSQNGEQSRGER